MGEVLRRLTSKCLARAIRHSVLSSLSPLQLGACVKGGFEAVIHAASHLMSFSTPSQCWTLLLDFSNAFNSINREAIFVETRRRSSTISAWMESCYSCQPFLLLGKDSIRSCCGVQQGDPLGPLGFALTLHPRIEKIKAELPGLTLNAWYLDDGTLMGHPEDLAAAPHIVERDGPSLGLHLNRSKSLLFIPEEADASQFFRSRLVKVRDSMGALRDIGDSVGDLPPTLMPRTPKSLFRPSHLPLQPHMSHYCGF